MFKTTRIISSHSYRAYSCAYIIDDLAVMRVVYIDIQYLFLARLLKLERWEEP